MMSVARKIPLILALFGVTFVAASVADVDQPRIRLAHQNSDLKVGPGMKASHRSLIGCEFVGQDLSSSDFTGSDLRGAVFSQCDLRNSSFRGVRIDRVGAAFFEPEPIGVVEGADFTDAEISWGKGTASGHAGSRFRLSPSQLRSTRNYKSQQLAHMVIKADRQQSQAYNFKNADLRHSALVGGDFSEADFSNAQIDGTYLAPDCSVAFDALSRARPFLEGNPRTLYDINWARGHLTGECDLSDFRLSNCIIAGTMGRSVLLEDTLFIRSIILDASSSQLTSTQNYRRRDFSGLKLYGCDLRTMDLSAFDLSDTYFDACQFEGVSLRNAVISRAQFSDSCSGLTTSQFGDTWNAVADQLHSVTLPRNFGSIRH